MLTSRRYCDSALTANGRGLSADDIAAPATASASKAARLIEVRVMRIAWLRPRPF